MVAENIIFYKTSLAKNHARKIVLFSSGNTTYIS